MKILIATDCYIYNTGGITASVLALCAGLRRLGHEVRTLSPSCRYKSFRDGDDYFVKSVPAFYYPGLRIAFPSNDHLLKEIEAWDPDIIHVQTEGSSYRMSKRIMKRCEVPLVMTCHTDYAHFLFGRCRNLTAVKGFMSVIGRIMYRRATAVIVPSEKAGRFPFLSSMQERLHVIPNGMELEKYQKKLSQNERQILRNSYGIDDTDKVIVTVSRLSKEKNVGELIGFLPALFKKLDGVKLLIVGDGPDKERLEKQVKKLCLTDSVIFTGRVLANDVWRYLGAGDVFASASTFEVHSMSYLEAMAQGLPLLCRADDALDGVLGHGYNGMIYRSQDEFADFAYRILADDRLRDSMGQNSLKKASDFSSDVFAASVISLYEKVLNKNRERSSVCQ